MTNDEAKKMVADCIKKDADMLLGDSAFLLIEDAERVLNAGLPLSWEQAAQLERIWKSIQ